MRVSGCSQSIIPSYIIRERGTFWSRKESWIRLRRRLGRLGVEWSERTGSWTCLDLLVISHGMTLQHFTLINQKPMPPILIVCGLILCTAVWGLQKFEDPGPDTQHNMKKGKDGQRTDRKPSGIMFVVQPILIRVWYTSGKTKAHFLYFFTHDWKPSLIWFNNFSDISNDKQSEIKHNAS